MRVATNKLVEAEERPRSRAAGVVPATRPGWTSARRLSAPRPQCHDRGDRAGVSLRDSGERRPYATVADIAVAEKINESDMVRGLRLTARRSSK
jgi:hypothetical protein